MAPKSHQSRGQRAPNAAHALARSVSCWISSCSPSGSLSLPCRSATPLSAIACEETVMTFDYSLAAIVTVALMIYLTYALIKPERF